MSLRSHEDPLCRRADHVIAIQVIHKRDGPKLPYQAVVIRQSAMHRKGRIARGAKGGVGPHTSSGPIPVFVFCCLDLQTGKNGGQQVADGNATATTISLLLEHVSDDSSLIAAHVVR